MNDARPLNVEIERCLTQADFDAFARLSGDDNPIHVDPAFAARTRFGRTVAHGLFLCTILRGLADRLLPGARQVSHKTVFPAPTFAGERMRFRAAVTGHGPLGVEVELTAMRVADQQVTCASQAVFARQEEAAA